MARTYKKVVKLGNCTGSNTEFYRDRNRKERIKNRHHLRNLLANYDLDTVDDLAYNIYVPYDSWDEPTDGHFILDKSSRKDWENGDYWFRKVGKYLKPKNPRHNNYRNK